MLAKWLKTTQRLTQETRVQNETCFAKGFTLEIRNSKSDHRVKDENLALKTETENQKPKRHRMRQIWKSFDDKY